MAVTRTEQTTSTTAVRPFTVAAWAQPERFTEELRAAFRSLR